MSVPADAAPASAELARVINYYVAGEDALAARLAEDTLRRWPRDARTRFWLGEIKRRQQDYAGAVKCYQRAIQGGLRTPQVFVAKGLAHRQAGQDTAALACFEHALRIDPACAEALANLGNLHFGRGDFGRAADCYEKAVALAAGDLQLRANLAAIYLATARLDEAARVLVAGWPAGSAAPRPLLLALARHLREQQRDDEALAIFRRLLATDPTDNDALNGYGATCFERGEFASARDAFARAVAAHPEDPVSRYHLGAALRVLKEDAAAASVLTTGLSLLDAGPPVGHAEADTLRQRMELEQACLQLAAGRYVEGWSLHAGRWYTHPEQPERVLGQHLWRGEALRGKRLIIAREQGIGDEVLFASVYGELQALAERLVIQCSARLAPACRRSFPHAELWPCAETPDAWRALLPRLGPDDVVCFAGSLPRWRRLERAQFPQAPYLVPDRVAAARWRERLEALGPGFKVGVSWRGGTRANYGDLRSIALSNLVRGWPSNLVLIDLQYDDTGDERAALQAAGGPQVVRFDVARDDFDATINLVSALDLVITVQTAVAHVAGALGIRTWVLVPQAPTTWRWLGDKGRTPWYPSVELIEQQLAGDWVPVLGSVLRKLARLGRPQRPKPTE